MAERKYWIGTVGPLTYDDEDTINVDGEDPIAQRPMTYEAPTTGELVDVDADLDEIYLALESLQANKHGHDNKLTLDKITELEGLPLWDGDVWPGGGGGGSIEDPVEFRSTTTHLQWRLIGEVDWIDLVALTEITGPEGSPGLDGNDGMDGLNSLSMLVFTSPLLPVDGDQLPEFYMPRAGNLTYVEASGVARSQDVIVDIKKNGSSVFTVTAKPNVPAAGGLGTRRVPDIVAFAQGDRITVHFADTDNSQSKLLVYIGFE